MNLFARAREAYEAQDVLAFLATVKTIVERNVRLGSDGFSSLAEFASSLGLDAVKKAIYEQGIQLYPSDNNLRRNYLYGLAHSDIPAERQRARDHLLELTGIVVTKDAVKLPTGGLKVYDLQALVIILDTYHADRLHEDALRITEALVNAHPTRCRVVRNHARTLRYNGRQAEALDCYRKAIFTPDADDTAAHWLAGELHNNEEYVDAAEAYLLACTIDPDDGSLFANAAEEMGYALEAGREKLVAFNRRPLPDGFKPETVAQIIRAAQSCGRLEFDDVRRIEKTMERANIVDASKEGDTLNKVERQAVAVTVYRSLQSSLTSREATHVFRHLGKG